MQNSQICQRQSLQNYWHNTLLYMFNFIEKLKDYTTRRDKTDMIVRSGYRKTIVPMLISKDA